MATDPRVECSYVPWSPLPTRPALEWPGGARLAVCVLVHVEHAELYPPTGSVIPKSLVHRGPYPEIPDVHEVTPREYGNRVGIGRVAAALERHGVAVTAPIDAGVIEEHPELARELVSKGWELIAHAPASSRLLSERMSETEELEYLERSISAVGAVTGKAVRGWAGVEYAETSRTIAILDSLGVDYVCDWPNDEQPYLMNVPSGPMVSLPVSIHLDDVFTHRRRGVAMERWSRSVCEAVARLHADGAPHGRVLVLGLHPWLVGHPFRIGHVAKALEFISRHPGVWLATGSEIVDWFIAATGA